LIEHNHNMKVTEVPVLKNWKEVYQYEVGI
jgi:hypothetical protein